MVSSELLPRERQVDAGQDLGLRENLADLQEASLGIIALFAGAIAYLWFMWVVWPLVSRPRPSSAWIGVGLLVLSACLSHALRKRHLRLAAHLLVWSILGAVVCAMLTFPSPAAAYLFILPVVFAGVLLSAFRFFLVAVGAIVLALSVGSWRLGIPVFSVGVALPACVIALVTVASWLSARNLHVALEWVWSGYERARRNEEIARERAGELQRALKALDEATHRLERINYMLALARDQADEARRLKQQFAQTISHELRTPLNLIVGFTELMTQSPEHYEERLPPLYLRDLSIVHRNARHLQTLVNDVLDLARIEAVEMSLLPEETDPATLVQEAVETARSLVEARGLALHLSVEPGLPPLWVDPIRIRQVLFNLLNNAACFTEEGSITVSVCGQEGAGVTTEKLPAPVTGASEVIFTVADTGAGIAPENMLRIFEEFHQADGSTRRRQGGVGLGLAISKRFVELHGGRIWVESQLGQGSTFHFSVPVGRTHVAAGQQRPAAEVARAASARGSEEPVLLAVTSSPLAAGLLTRYVHGCRTAVVPDLEQAQEMARRLMPQVVVIDRSCEELEAVEPGEVARAWMLPDTPFLACPLPGERTLRRQLAGANVNAFLVKPVSRQSLWDVLRRFGEGIERVLVVDDDPDFVRLLTRMLESAVRRYQVIGAYSGQEGLAMVRRRQPDLLLLDLVLPDMHGSQVVAQLRSKQAWRDIPIVIVSGQDEAGFSRMDGQEALAGGMAMARAKGLTGAEVVRWVQHVVDATVTPLPMPAVPRAVGVP